MSLLESGGKEFVLESIRTSWNQYLGYVWEDLVRTSIPRMTIDELHWGPASGCWSGRREHGIELDVVSASPDRKGELLIGEAKLHISHEDIQPLLNQLRNKVKRTPLFSSVDNIRYRLFVLDDDISHPEVISGKHIITT